MKKLAIFLTAICLCFVGLLGGCKSKTDTITVNEVTHSIFYAPMYIAINNGYFKDEGITIKLVNGGGADKSMTALLTGACQIGLMGPEAAINVAEQGRADQPKVFAQLTKRDGSFIIGRTDQTPFSLSRLNGKNIIGGRRGGVPAMTLQYLLDTNHITATMNYSIDFSNMTGAFVGGTGDYVTAFEPTASTMVANNQGYILASVGQLTGEVPYTAFMANNSYLTKNSQTIKAFIRAIVKGYEYLTNPTTTITQIVDALMPSFTGSSRTSIQSGIQAYIDIDAWADSPVMKESAYTRLLDIIDNAGELDERTPFATVVDNSYALSVVNK